MTTSRIARFATMGGAALLGLTACAAGAEQSGGTAGASADGSSADIGAAATDVFVPSVEVIDVDSEETLDLQSLVPAEQPVLLWAWAPHCPSCRVEAPQVEQFAQTHGDDVTVVGIGTQDDLGFAKDFIADTGVETPQMLWDPSFDSWRAMGITAQPTWILVSKDGSLLGGWVGPLPEDDILALVA